MHKRRAFTLIELIIVAAIIAILATLAVASVTRARQKAKLARVTSELESIATSVNQYASDNNYVYPPDTERSVPPGLEKYLAGGTWPTSIWPNGVFDWENWTSNGSQVYQITYRLCDLTDPVSTCKDPVLFPNFVRQSGIFYCIDGPCVPHRDNPTAPGYCVNCARKEVNY